MKNTMKARINNIEIEPVIARGIIFLFGHLFLIALMRLIIKTIDAAIKIEETTMMIIQPNKKNHSNPSFGHFYSLQIEQ